MSPWREGRTGPAKWGAFLRRFILLWLACSGLGTLLLFLFLSTFLSSPLTGGYGEVFYALRHLSETMLPVVVLSLLAYVLFLAGATVCLCIILLHKIAGPLFGLEKVLGTYQDGRPVRPFFMRHGDMVPELVSAFNGFVGRLREDRRRWAGVMENAERLTLQDSGTRRAEMEKALAELGTLLSRYR